MITFLYTLYRFGRGIRAGIHDPDFQVLLTLAIAILGIGTVTYHATEGWGWLDSLYFSVTTLTTIGFGDFSPHTTGGKMFTIVYILVGIGILLGFINALADHAVRESKEKPGFFGRHIMRRKKEKTSERIVPEIPLDPAHEEMQAEVEKAEIIR